MTQAKWRALLQHKSFNDLLIQYAVLDDHVPHVGPEKFAICFEAVAVIC